MNKKGQSSEKMEVEGSVFSMDVAAPDKKIHEALSAVGRYLSDTVPPVEAAAPVIALLNQPVQWMASEINNWITAQYQGNKQKASFADYLFHAIVKLHYLAHLQLVSEEDLAPYLAVLKELLLEYCPPEDREVLREHFGRSGMPESAVVSPIRLMYRQPQTGHSGSEVREDQTPEQSRDRRLAIVWNRLKSAVHETAPPEAEDSRQELVPQLIATAASEARTSDEFRKFQENLKTLGIDSETDHIYRTLSRSLPGWTIPATGAGAVKSHNPAVEAMGQIIQLAEDSWEAGKRFRDMVEAAIEQFNTGSAARAATMLDLALAVSASEKLNPDTVTGVRRMAHESLDANRLRILSLERDKHRTLRRILNFFHEFSVENVLNSLKKEGKRERRRLLLSLLEVHGDEARRIAFERLKEHLPDANIAVDWHFARNLVYILNQIPRQAGVSVSEEMNLVAPLLRLSLPSPLLKETIKLAGQTNCAESEQLLLFTADNLERIVLECAASGRDPGQRVSLLDRTIFALAQLGRPKGYQKVVKHGISRQEELGDTAARLMYLSGQDLSEDRESLALLLQFLKSKLPRKLLGVTIQKNEHLIIYAIKALSSTPAPIVRQILEDIAARFPASKFGAAAAEVLRQFLSLQRPGASTEGTLAGDLELFGLPDLLQQLDSLHLTGTLTLKDIEGNPAGTLSLAAGRIQHCSAGRLEGEEAAYQLLEKPMAGTFYFQGQKKAEAQEQPSENMLPDIDAVLAEGMRRHDELQRLRALVPDFAVLKRMGGEPGMPDEGDDPELFSRVWQNASAATSPEECEADCLADSYRVRTLLARWVEQGLITVE